jgi:hypothetical protein
MKFCFFSNNALIIALFLCFIGKRNSFQVRPSFRCQSKLQNFLRQYSNTDDLQIQKLISKIDSSGNDYDPIWETMKYEASRISENDMLSATLMTNSILSQKSLKEAITCYVSNQLDTSLFPATQLKRIFDEVCDQKKEIPTVF